MLNIAKSITLFLVSMLFIAGTAQLENQYDPFNYMAWCSAFLAFASATGSVWFMSQA